MINFLLFWLFCGGFNILVLQFDRRHYNLWLPSKVIEIVIESIIVFLLGPIFTIMWLGGNI